MDVAKLQGIVDAIDVEGKQPSPSHNNLARLTAMFMREVICLLAPSNKQSAYSPRFETPVETVPPIETESDLPKEPKPPKVAKHVKKAK